MARGLLAMIVLLSNKVCICQYDYIRYIGYFSLCLLMFFHMQKCVDDLLAAAHGRSTGSKYVNEVVDNIYDA